MDEYFEYLVAKIDKCFWNLSLKELEVDKQWLELPLSLQSFYFKKHWDKYTEEVQNLILERSLKQQILSKQDRSLLVLRYVEVVDYEINCLEVDDFENKKKVLLKFKENILSITIDIEIKKNIIFHLDQKLLILKEQEDNCIVDERMYERDILKEFEQKKHQHITERTSYYNCLELASADDKFTSLGLFCSVFFSEANYEASDMDSRKVYELNEVKSEFKRMHEINDFKSKEFKYLHEKVIKKTIELKGELFKTKNNLSMVMPRMILFIDENEKRVSLMENQLVLLDAFAYYINDSYLLRRQSKLKAETIEELISDMNIFEQILGHKKMADYLIIKNGRYHWKGGNPFMNSFVSKLIDVGMIDKHEQVNYSNTYRLICEFFNLPFKKSNARVSKASAKGDIFSFITKLK